MEDRRWSRFTSYFLHLTFKKLLHLGEDCLYCGHPTSLDTRESKLHADQKWPKTVRGNGRKAKLDKNNELRI